MQTDESLYNQYIAGEESAADILVEKYGDSLTVYINGYLHDLGESEDMMIEAFARVFAKSRPINGDGAFRAYLYKVGRNLALRYMKKHRLQTVDIGDFEPPCHILADTDLIRGERNRLLYSAIDKLRPEYREVIYLVYFEYMSYREAAKIMHKSEKQITKLLYNGKQSLKMTLTLAGFDPKTQLGEE